MVSQSDIVRYAAENPNLTKLLNNGKLQFTLTGMEFAPNTKRETLEAYAGGRAYRKAIWARENEGYDFVQHEPYIVPHMFRDENHFLFCKLTNSTLPRRKECIQKHVAGKRYQRRLREAEDARAENERRETKRLENALRARETKQKEETDHMTVDGFTENKDGAKGQRGEEENQDVLDGILSDSDDAMEMEASDTIHDHDMDMEDTKELTKRETVENLFHQEDEGSVFWTRGRRGAPANYDYEIDSNDDDDDDDEWKKAPQKSRGKSGRGAKRAQKGENCLPSALVGVERTSGEGPSLRVEQAGVTMVTGKRPRSGRPVKKVRRSRRRRKTATADT